MKPLVLLLLFVVVTILTLSYRKLPSVYNTETIPKMLKTDNFGINYLYQSDMQGKSWHANWANSIPRSLVSGQTDTYNDQFVSRGNGITTIDGKGIAELSGNNPRMYVYDMDSNQKWGDVEITVYMKRLSELKETSSQGLVIGARSEHQRVGTENPCYGRTYYARILYDGRYNFQKELVHDKAYSVNKPNETPTSIWDTIGGKFPTNTWIGAKFIVLNTQNNNVKLELYIDKTEGKNGGTWERIAEYTDIGDWELTEDAKYNNEYCGYPSNKIFLEPGTSIFVRNDQVAKVQYKNFNIREIIPELVEK